MTMGVRIVLHLDNNETDFLRIEDNIVVQVRVHGVEARLTVGAQSGSAACHVARQIPACVIQKKKKEKEKRKKTCVQGDFVLGV